MSRGLAWKGERVSKFTKGPWDNNSRKTVVRHTFSGDWIAEVGGRDTPEAIANAHLIATAPELLFSLQEILVAVQEGLYPVDIPNALEKAERAVAKAIGEGENE